MHRMHVFRRFMHFSFVLHMPRGIKEGPSLRTPRNRLGAVSLDGYIYVTGGSQQRTILNTVER